MRIRVPSGKMQIVPPRSSTMRAVFIASSSDSPRRMGKAPSRDRSHSRLESALSRMTLAFCFSAYDPATRSVGMNTSR